MQNHFSTVTTVFRERIAPEKGYLAGYVAIIKAYNLELPLPDRIAIISEKHKKYENEQWQIFTPRHAPESSLHGHLIFALKNEGINLSILKALFIVVSKTDIENIIKSEPTGKYTRKIWFLYEWLMEDLLSISDIKSGNFIDLLDSKLQYPGLPINSSRHRIRNNLPGTKDFCPLIRRTEKLENYRSMELGKITSIALQEIHKDILLRSAAFLLLKDSQASYAIEGERPAQNRAQRWGRAIGQAGQKPISRDELERLQQVVIESSRFIEMGYRKKGGFIGDRDRSTGLPLPDHISAKWEDLDQLIKGLIATEEKLMDENFDPVLAAAVVAFGFVFIHPFEDGNGRIHRYLIHHMLAVKNFAPKGIVFPVSAAILERIDEYRKVLEAYSLPRLELIEWRPTKDNNVEVLNNTIDLYRYYDATKQAEFLYECVEYTIKNIVPDEVDYLQKYDAMKMFINNQFDMPDSLVSLLIRFLEQGKGKLSKRALTKEFSTLTSEEVAALENEFRKIFVLA